MKQASNFFWVAVAGLYVVSGLNLLGYINKTFAALGIWLLVFAVILMYVAK